MKKIIFTQEQIIALKKMGYRVVGLSNETIVSKTLTINKNQTMSFEFILNPHNTDCNAILYLNEDESYDFEKDSDTTYMPIKELYEEVIALKAIGVDVTM